MVITMIARTALRDEGWVSDDTDAAGAAMPMMMMVVGVDGWNDEHGVTMMLTPMDDADDCLFVMRLSPQLRFAEQGKRNTRLEQPD
jgi:hypothetical protein